MFDNNYITLKIVDKKVAKRTAIQEQVVWPLRAYNNLMLMGATVNELQASYFREINQLYESLFPLQP